MGWSAGKDSDIDQSQSNKSNLNEKQLFFGVKEKHRHSELNVETESEK